MSSDAEDFQRLRDAPTCELWRIELERLLNGERERDMGQLADAGEYVRKTLALSRDRAKARAELSKALDGLVGEWIPGSPIQSERLWYLLDLLRMFPVASGAGRVLELFDNRAALAQLVPEYPGIDLRRKALEALAGYYSAPSSVNVAALDRYVDLLQVHLHAPAYAAYACKALLRLNRLDLDERSLEALLRSNERLVSPIVDWAFETSVESRALNVLTLTYSACLRFEMYSGSSSAVLFRQAVTSAGGDFLSEGARLVFPRSPAMPRELQLSEPIMCFHWTSEMNQSNARALATIAEQTEAQ